MRYLVAEKIEDALPMLRAAAERPTADRGPQDALSTRDL
jgi:hypothetical protein